MSHLLYQPAICLVTVCSNWPHTQVRTSAVSLKCLKRVPRREAIGFDTVKGTLVVGHKQDRWDRRAAEGRPPSESVRPQSHMKLYCYCAHTTVRKLQLLAPGGGTEQAQILQLRPRLRQKWSDRPSAWKKKVQMPGWGERASNGTRNSFLYVDNIPWYMHGDQKV